jgi:hypothetical protein
MVPNVPLVAHATLVGRRLAFVPARFASGNAARHAAINLDQRKVRVLNGDVLDFSGCAGHQATMLVL